MWPGTVNQGIVIGCDTIVECHGRILGKPEDRDDARRMLRLLSSRVHHVYSGLCLWRRPDDRTQVKADVTKLRMDRHSDAELEEYLDSGAWQGKAGAFGYQDRHGWIHVVSGSESNVVGLPLELLQSMLREMEGSHFPARASTKRMTPEMNQGTVVLPQRRQGRNQTSRPRPSGGN